ncbi:Fe-S cluster assembly ATPase SufC [Poseidonibacter ostreae]|jgi:Fe-S cluster assembly ATP-binding protein|uniref:Fe-S cluster assembly ATPase SufC n=1 Tax=Poseidonibacter ostreae TaxID=2654171 RepID=A0A6L4WQB8_9BACT|nr:Fe-S cluster assembly ATPase SufC [Poseidonibacter ostreae]KAB7885820.1 Fe-S cluster assembly ATPase SufC [Poseidonibacter ostreae]KAB7886866.1 Fe-S cluster assembly ATPase SufC [Poseidonibacter ostreae]KAB7889929.1 Fe-S cluster assembly ATPase SufC [Poseidonibacter ostreae]
MLEIKDLKVNINDKEILKGLNLNIKEGEVHALMGINGAGKSTLVKTLSAHYDCVVKEGSITYKKKDLLELDVAERANEGIFMSFQNPIEVPGVNNSYFLKTAINEKRAYAGESEIDTMDFLKLIKEQTSKYNLDKKLLQRDLNEGFSGGEKKRNELIQLLLLDPDLIMLDEIDSGLDVDAIKTVANVVNAMLDGKKSVLMITHYDRLLELIKPDFVHILNDGQIVKTGDYSLALELDEKGYEGIGIKDETK